MRAVFDLDDTICVHKNRDYINAKPISPVISKMRAMKNDGWEIIIYSARGQVSCKGNLEEIERKNRGVVEDWLKRYDVPYDELIFGKPIGDVYIDDKGMSLDDFIQKPFYYLRGGSGKKIYRIGGFVKKDLGDDVEGYKNWIEDNKSFCKYPPIVSYLYNQVTMKFIEGDVLCDSLTEKELQELINTIERFSLEKKEIFDIELHLEILNKNKSGGEFDKIIEMCAAKVKSIEHSLVKNASFCHGDMTLCNIIKADDGLYFIDPRYQRNASSYLLDYGKLRMSLLNYEKIFGISTKDNSKYLKMLDGFLKEKGIYDEIVILSLMYICRLYRYKEDKESVVKMADKLISEAIDVF